MITEYCRETNQPEPETPGQLARCILESLALMYAQTLDTIERLTSRTIAKMHIVGGGSQSELLNQFAASATGRTVIAGPVEATAVGNILIQAVSLQDLASLAEIRKLVRNSFSVRTYVPESVDAWKQAHLRFQNLVEVV